MAISISQITPSTNFLMESLLNYHSIPKEERMDRWKMILHYTYQEKTPYFLQKKKQTPQLFYEVLL